jgi:hypothetical protein
MAVVRIAKASRDCWLQVSITLSIRSTKRLPAAQTGVGFYATKPKPLGDPWRLFCATSITTALLALVGLLVISGRGRAASVYSLRYCPCDFGIA